MCTPLPGAVAPIAGKPSALAKGGRAEHASASGTLTGAMPQPPPPSTPVTIRPAVAADSRPLYEICLLTGDAGEDARALYVDRDLLGEVWVGP